MATVQEILINMNHLTLIDRIKSGEAEFSFTPITLTSSTNTDKVIIHVMKDAMKLDGIRFSVSAREQQEIADICGGIFHTSKTQDERHKAATVIIEPVVQVPPGSGKITANSTPEAIHPYIEKQIAGRSGLISSVGKPWIVTNNMSDPRARHGVHTSFNYGWHSTTARYTSPGGLKLWQPVVAANSPYVHNDEHRDPSQVCEFLSREAYVVDAAGSRREYDLEMLMKDPVYSTFLSYEGPLKVTRQMSLTRTTGYFVMPTVTV